MEGLLVISLPTRVLSSGQKCIHTQKNVTLGQFIYLPTCSYICAASRVTSDEVSETWRAALVVWKAAVNQRTYVKS